MYSHVVRPSVITVCLQSAYRSSENLYLPGCADWASGGPDSSGWCPPHRRARAHRWLGPRHCYRHCPRRRPGSATSTSCWRWRGLKRNTGLVDRLQLRIIVYCFWLGNTVYLALFDCMRYHTVFCFKATVSIIISQMSSDWTLKFVLLILPVFW